MDWYLPSTIFAYVICACLIYLSRPIAVKVGWVDSPTERKNHSGNIPLVGGACIFASYSITSFAATEISYNSVIFFLCASTIIVTGIVDDLRDISFKPRLLIQIGVGLTMVYAADIRIESLGSILGFDDINLGVWSPIFTTICLVAAINAFNMMDGIDGLCAITTIISLSFILLYSLDIGPPTTVNISILIFCFASYLLFNMQTSKSRLGKVFMGDSGSMLAGLSVAWLLIESTQINESLPPVMALWILGLPVADMIRVTITRPLNGRSPFYAGRDHIHHILLNLTKGNSKLCLIFTSLLAVLFPLLGALGLQANSSEADLLIGWLVSLSIYIVLVQLTSKSSYYINLKD